MCVNERSMVATISGGNNQLEKVCMILNKPFEMIISDNMFSSYCLLNPLTKQTTKMEKKKDCRLDGIDSGERSLKQTSKMEKMMEYGLGGTHGTKT